MSKRVEKAIRMGSQLSRGTDSNGSVDDPRDIRKCVYPDKVNPSFSPGVISFKNKPYTQMSPREGNSVNFR